MRLIYEKAALSKVKIVRLALENRGEISKEVLAEKLGVSLTTLEKYLFELYMELPKGALDFSGKNTIVIHEQICSLYDTQAYYLSKSIVKDILHTCFFCQKLSFDQLARKLYVSESKLFRVLKFLEQQLVDLNISIIRAPYIEIKGSEEAILVLYNLLLQIEECPYEVIFNRVEPLALKKKIFSFFSLYNMVPDNRIVEELGLWILTINDRFYLKKFCIDVDGEEQHLFKENFIDSDSLVLQSFNKCFGNLNPKVFDYEGCLLVLIFLIFNPFGLHFECVEDEMDFYNSQINAHYFYQDFILTILTHKNYEIDISNLNIVTLKIEGCLHYNKLLYAHFYLYGEFFNPNLQNSDKLKKMMNIFKDDFESYFFEKFPELKINDSMYKFLAYSISSFQKEHFDIHPYTLGIYSIKGAVYEEQLCTSLRNAIKIMPYRVFSNVGDKVDLLIVDDLRLLNSSIDYEDYRLLGDFKLLNDI